MKKVIMLAMSFIVVLSIISCQDDEIVSSDLQAESLDNKSQQAVDNNITNRSSSSILDAQSSTDIPSKFYRVDSKYKSSYQHLRQKLNECSWTTYVVTTGAIVNGNGGFYEVSNTSNGKVKRVKDKCRNHSGCTDSSYGSICASDISSLNWFAGQWDSNHVSKRLKATSPNSSGRFQMIKYMLNHIDQYGTPFIALGSYNGYGHYYTVWSIDWKQGGIGSTIFYTNTLDYNQNDFDQQIKSTDLSTFLNWMRDNPDAYYYNSLFLW